MFNLGFCYILLKLPLIKILWERIMQWSTLLSDVLYSCIILWDLWVLCLYSACALICYAKIRRGKVKRIIEKLKRRKGSKNNYYSKVLGSYVGNADTFLNIWIVPTAYNIMRGDIMSIFWQPHSQALLLFFPSTHEMGRRESLETSWKMIGNIHSDIRSKYITIHRAKQFCMEIKFKKFKILFHYAYPLLIKSIKMCGTFCCFENDLFRF